MRTLTLYCLLFAVSFMAGCATVQVSQDYDPHADMLRSGTWHWRAPVQAATGDIRIDNPLLDKRIRRAVEDHLLDRQFVQVTGAPDVYLSYYLTIEQRIFNDTVYSTAGVGSYHHPWYGGFGTETRITVYDEGRLTIDIHLAGTGELMWRGVGIFRFSTQKTPQEAEEVTRNIVNNILSQFPPVGQP